MSWGISSIKISKQAPQKIFPVVCSLKSLLKKPKLCKIFNASISALEIKAKIDITVLCEFDHFAKSWFKYFSFVIIYNASIKFIVNDRINIMVLMKNVRDDISH